MHEAGAYPRSAKSAPIFLQSSASSRARGRPGIDHMPEMESHHKHLTHTKTHASSAAAKSFASLALGNLNPTQEHSSESSSSPPGKYPETRLTLRKSTLRRGRGRVLI